MNYFKVVLFALALSFSSLPIQSFGETRSVTTSTQTQNESDTKRATALISRLNAIKEMNKSNKTRAERKDLRVEVRSIREEMKHLNSGIYISFTAILIIVILILLL